MAKKPTCPICMTKLRLHTDGHTRICPECGYKLCDHAYEYRDLYDLNHSHSDYVTYSENTYEFHQDDYEFPNMDLPPLQNNMPQTPAISTPTSQRPVKPAPKAPAGKKKTPFWVIVIIIYVVLYIIGTASE